jgi:hypothetical protein
MSKTKYRIRRRANGWAVQQYIAPCFSDGSPAVTFKPFWHTLAVHRYHWLAAFRLAWLREWAR